MREAKENGTIEKLVQVLHNVTYSYAIVREAAQNIQKQEEWHDNEAWIKI